MRVEKELDLADQEKVIPGEVVGVENSPEPRRLATTDPSPELDVRKCSLETQCHLSVLHYHLLT